MAVFCLIKSAGILYVFQAFWIEQRFPVAVKGIVKIAACGVMDIYSVLQPAFIKEGTHGAIF
jgi:hypothetical protein